MGSFSTEAANTAARPTSASPQKLTSDANEKLVTNGMDRPRSRPQRRSECARGACQKKERRHASHVQRSRSDDYRNGYGKEHSSHDWPRFARRHRVAREGLTRTHRFEACEPAIVSHWHRSRYGDTLCCS